MTAEREALERLERQLSTCRDSYEAPSGKIMFRVWGNDLGAILKLARQALANPATIRDTDALKCAACGWSAPENFSNRYCGGCGQDMISAEIKREYGQGRGGD